MSLAFSVIIPNYNGRKLLEKYIPSVVKACMAAGSGWEILISDDNSSDDSVEYLRSLSVPNLRVIESTVNRGFAGNINRGVAYSAKPIAILLNSDVEVERNAFTRLLPYFKNKKVFAVVSKSLSGEKKVNESVTMACFTGVLDRYHESVLDPELDYDTPIKVLHASGGFGAFDREKFLLLGGFDSVYEPFYYEDVDLSYMAWKNGWEVWYEPKSVVHHESHATIKNIADKERAFLMERRNLFFYTWKNLHDKQLMRRHMKFIVGILRRAVLRKEPEARHWVKALLLALPRLPLALWRRKAARRFNTRSDEEILRLISPRKQR